MASSFFTFALSICCLKSGPASITIVLAGSLDHQRSPEPLVHADQQTVHTAHSQAITGTPWDVPVPRKVIFTGSFYRFTNSNLKIREEQYQRFTLAPRHRFTYLYG
ncbi:MAG: hypothetical protein MZV63_11505 [Marinilabiliales bacterium]|nr:hypothetical protein [Marinilabiliales bacterium]